MNSKPVAVIAVLSSRISAAILLALSLPALGIIFVLMKLLEDDGGPFLYTGLRIGKNWRPFTIYKIRTMHLDAEQRIGADLHDDDRELELRMGRFLRATRLDELPQLLNIVKGEMAFVGPRPVRPAVYEKQCKHVPDYQARFTVLPGLTGLSQSLTPHGTPKQIRARIDGILLRKMRSPVWRLTLIVGTAVAVVRNILKELVRTVGTHVPTEVRHRLRRNPVQVRGETVEAGGRDGFCLEVIRIHEGMLYVLSDRHIKDGTRMQFSVSRMNSRKRAKSARCMGVVKGSHDFASFDRQDKQRAYVIEYKPVSALQGYFFDRHILRLTVI